MIEAGRRGFLIGSAALSAATVAGAAAPATTSQIGADLARYIGFGLKAAGGTGDNACGEWIAAELSRVGFAVSRQEFTCPFFEASRCALTSGSSSAAVWPQPIVRTTGPGGVTGPLVRVDRTGVADGRLSGAIALIDLPFARWSSAMAKPVREPIAAALAAGALGVVLITNGPTGKAIALNADGHEPMFARPVAVLAPQDAKPFLAAANANAPATLLIEGRVGRRPAFNVQGRIDRGMPRWLVVSTPRSGWFTCAGERGPGVAVWLHLARWASKAVRTHNVAFVCNSGHEYEYLGAAEGLKTFRPLPAETDFWLHLGANVAARDWHEAVGDWRPLPSVDPQRFLSGTPSLQPLLREVFAGHLGYEAPYSNDVLSAGELDEILAAGYKRAVGVFGIHRFHHTTGDDERCVSPASVARTAAAFHLLVKRVMGENSRRTEGA